MALPRPSERLGQDLSRFGQRQSHTRGCRPRGPGGPGEAGRSGLRGAAGPGRRGRPGGGPRPSTSRRAARPLRRSPGAARGPCRPASRRGRSTSRRGTASCQSTARLKSKSLGDALGGQQDVGGLEVAVRHALAVGVVERLGEPGDDPGQGLGIGQPGDDLAGRPGQLGRGVFGSGDPVEVGQEVAPGSGAPAELPPCFEDRRQGRPAEERHADQVQGPVVGVGLAENLDDVRVAGPGQQPRLGRRAGRDLEHDQATVEVSLLGEEDASERASTQLPEQAIRPDLVAAGGEVRRHRPSRGALTSRRRRGGRRGGPASRPARGTGGGTRPGRGRGPTPRPDSIRDRSARRIPRPRGARGNPRPGAVRRAPSSR